MIKRILLVIFILLALFLSGCNSQDAKEAAEESIIQIACGNDFTLFLYNTGKVRAIGKNSSGQLGVGDTKDRYELTEVLLPEPVCKIGVSDDTAYALTANNILYLWGDNRYRQVENSDESVIPTPKRYDIRGKNRKEEILQVALGWSGVYALTKSGTLYGWGSKYSLLRLDDVNYDPAYQATPLLQFGTSTDRRFPVVGGEEGELYAPQNISMIAIGSGTVMGLGEDRMVFGHVGEDGLGAYPFEEGDIVKIAVGRTFYVLLTREGSLYLWGNNTHGELGTGDYKEHKTPVHRIFADDPL